MKTIRFSALLMLFGLLVMVSACKKETNTATATQTGSKILVTGQDAGTGLKSTLSGQTTVWKGSDNYSGPPSTADQVGIYSDIARTLSGGSPNGVIIINAPFTAANSAASSAFSGTMYWGTGTATDHKFYAYYPYSASAGSDATVVPVSLTTAQTQSAANSSAHIGALDFLVATPKTVTSPANTDKVVNEVNLSYNHLFTVLEFQIKGSGTLTAVKLSGNNTLAFSGGTIDITQTTPATGVAYTFASKTGTSTQAVVTLTTPATLDASTATSVYMVINPGTQTGNCQISVLADGTAWKYIAKTALSGGFLRGNKYVVSIDAATATDNITDVDGNTYGTVTIGTQTWISSNLKTTHYNDGTAIPNVTDNTTWAGLATGAYCWYNNDSITYKSTYGALYNWYAVSTKLCPTGWHVPKDGEWTTLTDYLGGLTIAGGKLIETGTTHWVTPNTGATNSSGFTALPGGYRSRSGTFSDFGSKGYWWSTEEFFSGVPIGRELVNSFPNAYNYLGYEGDGVSVRCLRN